MIVTIEYIDGTPDEVHEDIVHTGHNETGQFLWLVHEDGSETYVNFDTIRTVAVLDRLTPA